MRKHHPREGQLEVPMPSEISADWDWSASPKGSRILSGRPEEMSILMDRIRRALDAIDPAPVNADIVISRAE